MTFAQRLSSLRLRARQRVLLLLLWTAATGSCTPSEKAVTRNAADAVVTLCKLLPPLDAVEADICATAPSADAAIDKIFSRRRDLGLLPAPSASAPASSPLAPAPAPLPSGPASAPPAPAPLVLAFAAPAASSAAPASSAKPGKAKK